MNANRTAIAILLSAACTTGCATNPERLQEPPEVTCIHVKEPLLVTGHYGLFKQPVTTRLDRGPYWSEKMDERGTYYRAPPGGVSINAYDGNGLPYPGTYMDGGFYVPNSPTEPITIYKYASASEADVDFDILETDCSTAGYIKDPVTSKVSFASFAASGALGGATGGIISRSMVQGSSMSYGESAGVGIVGGAVAGLVLAALINAEVGKINPGLPIQDAQFMDRLRALAATKVPIREVPLSSVREAAQAPTLTTGEQSASGN